VQCRVCVCMLEAGQRLGELKFIPKVIKRVSQ
jgi:hypothetical protein